MPQMRTKKAAKSACDYGMDGLSQAAASEVFMALLEAERWLFAAGQGLSGGNDPETAAAIEAIRRKVCERLERLQECAYRDFDGKLGAG